MKARIPVTRSMLPSYEEFCEEIRDLWDSHWLTNMGSKHQALQEALEERLNVPHVTLYSNGHLALEGALEALDLPRGSQVITTPFTFVSTTHAIARKGLIPVFCDVRKDNYTLDADKIEELITERTSAILPVHVYGNICDVDRIQAIAKAHNLKVIYDAAHAFGVKYRGESAVRFGDASILSFHATKVFHTIEGGAVCFTNGELSQKLDDIKNFGIRDEEVCVYAGGNAKMNEFQAAMGLCNLRHIDAVIAKRKAIVERYIQRLDGIAGLTVWRAQRDVEPNYAYFPVVFDEEVFGANRDEIAQRLAKQGIKARKYFYPLTSSLGSYKERFEIQPTPTAEYIAQSVLTLPLYAELKEEDVDQISDIILGA